MLGHHAAGPYILQSGASEILGTHQLPVGGFKLAQDPVTRQLYIIPGRYMLRMVSSDHSFLIF